MTSWNLHSTIFILKLSLYDAQQLQRKNLHSTIFILKQLQNIDNSVNNLKFTFYYIYIKT